MIINLFKSKIKATKVKKRRELSHGELIEKLILQYEELFEDAPVFAETGCRLSTIYLAKMGRRLNALV